MWHKLPLWASVGWPARAPLSCTADKHVRPSQTIWPQTGQIPGSTLGWICPWCRNRWSQKKKNKKNKKKKTNPTSSNDLHWFLYCTALLPQSNPLLSSRRPPHLHTNSDNSRDFARSDGYKKSWVPSWISSLPSLTLNGAHTRSLKR